MVFYHHLRSLLYNNYYITLKDIKISPSKVDEFSKLNDDLVRITTLLKSEVRTEEISKEIEDFQDKYYKEILYDNAYQY